MISMNYHLAHWVQKEVAEEVSMFSTYSLLNTVFTPTLSPLIHPPSSPLTHPNPATVYVPSPEFKLPDAIFHCWSLISTVLSRSWFSIAPASIPSGVRTDSRMAELVAQQHPGIPRRPEPCEGLKIWDCFYWHVWSRNSGNSLMSLVCVQD